MKRLKKIKFAVCFFLLFFCLTLNGELYQAYLDEFTGGVYNFYATKMFGENDSDIEKKRQEIVILSEKNNCRVFCVDKKISDVSSAEIIVCVPDKITADEVKKELNIASGEYKSLFSGVTKVSFKDFNEAPDNMNFYFLGEEENIWNIKKNFGFNAGRLKKEQIINVQWLSPVAWLVFGVLLLFLTWFDIQFQKKENIVMISLGKPTISIILKNIFTDIAFLVSSGAVLVLVLNRFTYLFYNINITMILFATFVLLNSLVYIVMFRYDLKMALSKYNFSNSVLSNCYVLKALSMIITILTLSANILIVADNGMLLNQQENIAKYKDYSFLDVYGENHYEENTRTNEIIESVKADIIFREYLINDVAFSAIALSGRDCDYLIINKNAIGVLADISSVKDIDFTKDYYILLPDNCKNPEEKVNVINEFIMNTPPDMSCDVLTYHENKKILCFKNRQQVINFDVVKTPIIVLCDFSKEILKNENKMRNTYLNNSYMFGDMMFEFSEEDIAYYEEKYNLEENSIVIKKNNVAEKSEYGLVVLERTIALSSALSVFMLFLELLLITTITKLEYITNSVENSLKKILGYSLFERNKTLFLLNGFSVFIGVFTTVIVALLLKNNIWIMFLAVGVVIFILECIAICYYATKLERTSVPKILKGGCL